MILEKDSYNKGTKNKETLISQGSHADYTSGLWMSTESKESLTGPTWISSANTVQYKSPVLKSHHAEFQTDQGWNKKQYEVRWQ